MKRGKRIVYVGQILHAIGIKLGRPEGCFGAIVEGIRRGCYIIVMICHRSSCRKEGIEREAPSLHLSGVT